MITFNLFNHGFKYVNDRVTEITPTAYIAAGQECPTISIEELVSKDLLNRYSYAYNGNIITTTFSESQLNPKDVKEYLPALQIFNSGFRWGGDFSDWKYWNGTIFVDIDSKKYGKPFDFSDFENKLFDFINKDQGGNFYFMQKSASGNSLHLCFYYSEQERGETSERVYKYLAKKLLSYVKYAMRRIGYDDVAKAKGVIDSCSEKPAQPWYMSNHEIRFGHIAAIEKDLGFPTFGSMPGFDINDVINTENEEVTYFEENSNLVFEFDKKQKISFTGHIPDFISDWSHQTRFSLMKIFIKYFGADRDKAVQYYTMIADFIAAKYNSNSKAKYTSSKLISLFKNQYNGVCKRMAYELLKKNPDQRYTSFSSKLLKFFELVYGVKSNIEGVNEIIDFIPDEEINLKENEYIGTYYYDILSHVKSNGNVYIQAGCGLGKSYFFKNLFKQEEKVIIVCHLNSIKDSVYAAEITNEDVVIPTNSDIDRYIETGNLPNKLLVGWNQMQKLCLSLRNPYNKIDLREYYKCFDEIHNIITTMGYRHSVIYDIVGCPQVQDKCICVTATSCGEFSIFCPNAYKFKFNKEKKYQQKIYYAAYDRLAKEGITEKANIYQTVNNLIETCLTNQFDAVVVFDNKNHAEFARHWGNEALHYYKGNRNEPEVVELQKTNTLKHKIFITTTYGTEGIEIKNELKKVAFIIPLNGITDVIVEQLVNRFRNKEVVNIIFVGDNKTDDMAVSKEYDGLVLNIINEIKQNNPEYQKWLENENYYLSAWLYWNNTDLDNEKLDLFPKLVMLYHNYLYRFLINGYNIYNKYPELKIGDVNVFDFSEIEEFNENPELKLIAKYPALVFEQKTDETCYELLSQFYNNKTDIKGSGDMFSEDFQVTITSTYIPYTYIRNFRMIMEYCQYIYYSSDPGTKLDFLWHPERVDYYKEQLSLLHMQPDFKFVVNLIKLFTRENKFKYKQFKRFWKTRKKITSETITQVQKEKLQKDIDWYNGFLKKENLKDDLTVSMLVELGAQLEQKFKNGREKRCRKGEAVGKAVGKAVHKKYVLIDNPFIEFSSHEECWQYAKNNLMVTVNLNTWIKKGIWKNYFVKG